MPQPIFLVTLPVKIVRAGSQDEPMPLDIFLPVAANDAEEAVEMLSVRLFELLCPPREP